MDDRTKERFYIALIVSAAVLGLLSSYFQEPRWLNLSLGCLAFSISVVYLVFGFADFFE
jgi:hypothetical protein